MQTAPHADARTLNAVLRNDFPSFVRKSFNTVNPGTQYLPNWHIEAISYQLERIRRGEIRKLLITMPPRSLKSLSISVAFPAYLFGKDPTKKIVCISYSDELATKHARDSRTLMESRWYKDAFPGTRLSHLRSAEYDFETTRRGNRLSTSVKGGITGRGGSLTIIDDPQKPSDAMSVIKRTSAINDYKSTLISRADDKRYDATIVVMQRLHGDDLAGHLLDAGGWTHLNLPAIATEDERIEIGGGRVHLRRAGEALHPEREPLEVLDQLKAEMGSFIFSSQYQQSPLPEAGNLVKAAWLRSYSTEPTGRPGVRVIQSWDLAVKDGENSDYSVCITAVLNGNFIFIRDVFRARIDYPSQRREFVRLARQHEADVILVEAAANGAPLIADLADLRASDVPTPIARTVSGSKIERLTLHSHRIEAGDVLLPEKAPWLDEFRSELLGFPKGRHDDQVDALSQLLSWVAQDAHSHQYFFAGPIMIRGD